jgi:hypothetical protein
MTEAKFDSKTLRGLGYTYSGESKCKGCGAIVEWWITPNDKRLPIDREGRVAHWATCPVAQRFRKK